MENLYLLLGGNLGDKKLIFKNTCELLRNELGDIVLQSAIYETEPWGFESNDMFWNQALVIKTSKSAEECLQIIHQVEAKIGRVRGDKRYASRMIDVDILFYGDEIINTDVLEVPHPRMIDRKFVLVPLVEIAANKIHPLFQKSVVELLEECTDDLAVKKLV